MKKFIREVNKYYPTYLLAHQHPVNKVVHMIGNLVVVGLAGFLTYLGITVNPFILALLPLHLVYTIYLFAWPGHLFIEKNKPATWKVSRWITKACDWKMMFQLVTGQLQWDTRKKLHPRLVKFAIQDNPAGLLKNVGQINFPDDLVKDDKEDYITWVDKK